MKYIALLVVLLGMGWTWSMAQGERDMSLADNREIENQIEEMIRAQITAKEPDVKAINFHQLFTEVIQPGHEMQVHVRYTIEDKTSTGDIASQMYEGVIKLKSADGRSWALDGQEMQSPLLEFKEGMRIEAKTAESDAKAESSHQESAVEKAPEPAHH